MYFTCQVERLQSVNMMHYSLPLLRHSFVYECSNTSGYVSPHGEKAQSLEFNLPYTSGSLNFSHSCDVGETKVP